MWISADHLKVMDFNEEFESKCQVCNSRNAKLNGSINVKLLARRPGLIRQRGERAVQL